MRTMRMAIVGIVLVSMVGGTRVSLGSERNLVHSDVPELPDVLEATGPMSHTIVEADRLEILSGAVFELRWIDGAVTLAPEPFEAGAVLGPGVYWAIDLVELDTGEALPIAAGELLVVAGLASNGADVSCRSGYFACCFVEKGGRKKARCRPDNEDDSDCDAGGKGSVSCGWTTQAISEAVDADG